MYMFATKTNTRTVEKSSQQKHKTKTQMHFVHHQSIKCVHNEVIFANS